MRRAALLAGAASLAAAWAPDWEGLLGTFPAHMLRHMTLVAIAAPLLALGLPGLVRRAPPLVAAAAFEFVVVWSAHLPALHAPAQAGGAAFAAEQAFFLVAGLAIWTSALNPQGPLAGALGLLLTSMHMTMLGSLLVLAPGDLYAEICGRAPDLPGQQLGGLLMLAVGTVGYMAGGLALAAQALKHRPA